MLAITWLVTALSASTPLIRVPRSTLLRSGSAAALFGGNFPNPFGAKPASAAVPGKGTTGATNEIVKTVDGIRHKRLGGGDIIVSEIGLGTQRWGGADFNSPDEALCHKLMDRAILNSGVNLIDTAEQYPIPSDRQRPEGDTERIIGTWLKKDAGRRQKVVISSKITGGRNINAKTIQADCEASLQRLGTDYLDVYLLHWPARYSPQSNWGQSLAYNPEIEQCAIAISIATTNHYNHHPIGSDGPISCHYAHL